MSVHVCVNDITRTEKPEGVEESVIDSSKHGTEKEVKRQAERKTANKRSYTRNEKAVGKWR